MEQIIANLLDDFESGKMTRRDLINRLAVTATAASVGAAAAAEGTVCKAVSINHISYQVADYTKTRDFYANLLGMTISDDNGKQCRLAIGDAGIIAHNYPSDTPRVDHIAYAVANWDRDKGALGAELKRRGLLIRGDAKTSFHIKDPDGFDVQIVGQNYVEKT
jgi:catechol 2,3-dioxygenase-like lactoylglutathione lyase family enzyme